MNAGEPATTISIHALRGEGDHRQKQEQTQNKAISIHALRGEGDEQTVILAIAANYFNPRPPWGGRRQVNQGQRGYCSISIHALRGEGDLMLK